MRQIEAALDKLRDEYRGESYHIVKKNCNHFSDALCRAVGDDVSWKIYLTIFVSDCQPTTAALGEPFSLVGLLVCLLHL